jgi:hypothetical protein
MILFNPVHLTIKKEPVGLRMAGIPKFYRSMEGAPGFEPGMRDLQSLALPLGYAPVSLCNPMEKGDVNTTPHRYLVAAEGLEPPTLRV